MDCFIIGRDLVRLLQNVARIPEMELLWRDLLHNPQTLSPQFTGPHLSGSSHWFLTGSRSTLFTISTSRPFRHPAAPVLSHVPQVPGMSTNSGHGDEAALHDFPGNLDPNVSYSKAHVRVDEWVDPDLYCPVHRSDLGSRSGTRTGSSGSTCRRRTASRCAAT